MKKLILTAAIFCAGAVAQAATVGWSCAGLTSYTGDAYQFFVIGQNNVTGVDQIVALLEAGSDVSSYAFGSGAVSATGQATTTASASGKSLEAGTYTSFMALFDSATPAAGTSQYVVVSGGANQTKTIGATTATVTFVAGNVSSLVNDASNWSSYGAAVPEPTSGLLVLLGMAGLALKRKVA